VRLLLSAVEPSGDRLGAELLGELRRQGVQTAASGLGGAALLAAGLVPVAPLAPPAMGLVEVLRHLGAIRRQGRALHEAARLPADAMVCVDAPDFHVPLATAARRAGRRTVGLVSPQLWAWRRGRAPAVARAYDRLLCLFDFEPALYAGTGLRAEFVGHPAIDRRVTRRTEPGTVAIFPGSRPSELRRHLHPFLAATRRWPRVLLAQPPGAGGPPPTDPRVHVVTPEQAMIRCERALSKSGTVTLELALNGIPSVVAHRVHPLTYAVGRLLVRQIRFLALPNLLLDRPVFREFVQFGNGDADALASALREAAPPAAEELAQKVGPPGVMARIAQSVIEVARSGMSG
jgi:lipid-A-disaccharide synthase